MNDLSSSSQLTISTFAADLNKLVLSHDFANVIFLWPFDELISGENENFVTEYGMKYHRIYAHKAISTRIF